ncbi:ATP-binding protein [Rhabdothermincola sp.]|uniref:ATP-binding protein n=1 Tax=Rhabdothermincola sp. TaxID=2820405 RepID=UPI002FE38426
MTTTPRRFEAHFPPDLGSARAARRFVLSVMGRDHGTEDEVELMVSELASNVILHACTPFTIRVDHDEVNHVLRVECHDGARTLPVLKGYAPRAVTGRGLQIIDHLADRWGVEVDHEGKTVWFEVGLGGCSGSPPDDPVHNGDRA